MRRTSGILILALKPSGAAFGTVNVSEHEQKNSYTFEDLIECAKGNLFGPGNAQLPLPPMLMFDRIVKIDSTGGKYGKGEIISPAISRAIR